MVVPGASQREVTVKALMSRHCDATARLARKEGRERWSRKGEVRGRGEVQTTRTLTLALAGGCRKPQKIVLKRVVALPQVWADFLSLCVQTRL